VDAHWLPSPPHLYSLGREFAVELLRFLAKGFINKSARRR
jgi:hypothetical protein